MSGGWAYIEKAWICKSCRRSVTDDAMPSDMDLDCVCTDSDERREQRRYEIARDVMAARFWQECVHKDTDRRYFALEAVRAADALLAALEETER